MKITIINLIGSTLALVGCLFIFNGRSIVRKHLNFGEENLAVKGIKILGVLLGVVGVLMMM